MKCNICDKDMSDKEVSYNEDLKAYEPCTTCLDIALDAAYSQGFHTEDDEFEYCVDEEFDAGAAEFNHYGERVDGETD
jgi:hypothetical protein